MRLPLALAAVMFVTPVWAQSADQQKLNNLLGNVQNDKATFLQRLKEDDVIQSATIIVEASANQIVFERDYKGKIFQGSLPVIAVFRGYDNGTYDILLGNVPRGITCTVKNINDDTAAKIKRGQWMSFSGLIDNTVLGHLQLKNCEISY